MVLPRLNIHKLAVVVIILAAVMEAAAAANGVAKEGCKDRCGNVSIPYPFGLSPECYRDEAFLITCNESSEGDGGPRAILRKFNTTFVTNISVEEGELYILRNNISRVCYNSAGEVNESSIIGLSLSSFWISDTKNKFTAIGCNTRASISGRMQGNERFQTGCISMCPTVGSVSSGACAGIGCCQTSFPKGVRLFWSSVTNQSSSNVSNDFCSYAFVVQEDKFNFSSDWLYGLTNEELPMVLDWAIGNESCPVAKGNSTSYACQQNSYCEDVNDGYRCRCNPGFHGNPYLGACQDIDECKDPNLNTCAKKCKNIPGSFTCSCPWGYETAENDCIADELLIVKIVVCIGVSIIVLLVCFCCLYFGLKKRKLIMLKEQFFRQNGGYMLQQELSRREGSNSTAKIFSAEELERATNNYDESRIIGRGGYGTVYKGVLADRIVAIKKSKVIDKTQIEQFINEVVVLSQINHRNVVKLLGCCLETEVPLLVYEFITNGTLFDHIHNENKAYTISWEIRLRIAAETAGVLSYLHSAASIPIIHRDVKPTNILLDHRYTAKVSDFGASRLVPQDQDELSTMVQGTLGYLDPEYMHTSELTEKSDVYSFGVVLVELLTGKKALCFKRPEEERNLAKYFLSSFKEGHLFKVLEEHIMNEENIGQLMEVAKIARCCLRLKGEERPTMKEVAMELEGLRTVENHPWVTVNLSSEETQTLLVDTSDYDGGGVSSNTEGGYNSIIKQVSFELDDGR